MTDSRTDAYMWTQREIVIVATLGVVFSVLYLAIAVVWKWLQPITGDIATDLLFGLWCVASVVAAYIVRKPGAAFGAEVIAAICEVLTGNPAGLILVLTGVVQGAGAELAFAVTGWRNYRLPVLLASGASAAVFSFVYTWIRFDYGRLDIGLLALMFGLRVASGMLLAGWLGRFIAERLRATGVLKGLAIDSKQPAAV